MIILEISVGGSRNLLKIISEKFCFEQQKRHLSKRRSSEVADCTSFQVWKSNLIDLKYCYQVQNLGIGKSMLSLVSKNGSQTE